MCAVLWCTFRIDTTLTREVDDIDILIEKKILLLYRKIIYRVDNNIEDNKIVE